MIHAVKLFILFTTVASAVTLGTTKDAVDCNLAIVRDLIVVVFGIGLLIAL